MSLRDKTISSMFWTFSEQFGSKGINFIISIVLARVLLPEEFGLIGMIAVFIGIGNSLVDSGMSSSLIRTKNPDNEDYSSVFLINIVASVIIYLIIYFTAPAIANFYGNDILVPIIRVYSVTIFIRALVTVQITRLTKEMNFKVQMIIRIPSIIFGGIIGVSLALSGWGVWSLVYMAIAESIISTIQYWYYSGWRPELIINRSKLFSHFNFGYKLTLSGLLHTVFTNIYNILIGRFFSPAQVGFYTRAYDTQMYPANSLSGALNKVTYPMFAKIQDDDNALRKTYRTLMQQIVFWIAPILSCSFIIAEPMFSFVFTEKWLPAVPYFRILCVVGLLYPLQSYNLNILKVKGRSDLFLKLAIVKRAITALGIIVALNFGIYGLLYWSSLNSIIAFGINSHYSGRFISYRTISQIRDILPLMMIAFGSAWLTYTLLYNGFEFSKHSDLLQIGVAGFIFIGIYLVLSKLLYPKPMNDFREIIISRI